MSDKIPNCPPKYYSLDFIGKSNYSSFYVVSRIYPRSRKKFFLKCVYLKDYTLKIEQECAIQLQMNHPNIMPINDHFQFKDHYFIEMPLGVGPIANDLLIDIQCIYKIMFQISHAVNFLHNQHILHGDINPNNIVLMNNNSDYPLPRLIDFGFAQDVSSKSCCCHHMTVEYSAPEVLGMEPHSLPSDIWSLGATFYYMITHRKIITDPNKHHKTLQLSAKNRTLDYTNIFEDPRNFGKYFTDSGKILIDSMLNVDPNKRPTAIEIIKDPFFNEVLDQNWINNLKIKFPEYSNDITNFDEKEVEG